VALTFVHNRTSWQQLKEINDYFNAELTPIDISDWDEVEILIQKIIKSSRAGKSTAEMTR
jgi:ATP-dependent RNA helicase DDX19/DBP5